MHCEAKNGTSSASTKNLSFQFSLVALLKNTCDWKERNLFIWFWGPHRLEQLGARQNSGRFGKGLRLKRSKTGQLRTPSIWNKVWTNKQNYCSNIDIHVQSDCNQFESGQRWQFWKRILVFSILVMLSTLISNTTKYHQQFIRKKRHCHPHNLGGDQGWTPRPAGNPPRGEGKGTLFSKICQHIWNSSSMSKISSLMLLMMMAIMLVIMLMIIMMLMIIIMVLLIMSKIKIMNVV